MTDFFDDVDSIKASVKQSIHADIMAAIRKAHYTHGVSIDLATVLACEAVVECHSTSDNRGSESLARTLRWMADEVENRVAEPYDEADDGIVYE